MRARFGDAGKLLARKLTSMLQRAARQLTSANAQLIVVFASSSKQARTELGLDVVRGSLLLQADLIND